jgi:hypothetical protein
MKRIIALILSFFFAFPALAEVPEDAWVMCQPDSEVVVRVHPNRHSEEAARVFPGDHLTLTGKKQGRWYEVYHLCENGGGWVRGDFLSFSEPEVFEGGKEFVTTKGKLVARFSIKGRVRKKFKKAGATVKVFLMADEWSVTNQGYIMSKYLEAVSEE